MAEPARTDASTENAFRTWGEAMSASLDRTASARAAAHADEPAVARLLVATDAQAGSSMRARRMLLAAACVVCAVAFGLFLRPSDEPRLTAFFADAPLATGSWRQPTDGAVLRFSDGTRFVFGATSRIYLEQVGARGASVTLDSGEADVEVVPGHDSSWWITAGPFRVHVHGTKFEVSWAPEVGRFVLDLREGQVSVTGPTLAGDAHLRAGQRLEVSLREQRATVGPRLPPGDPSPGVTPATEEEEARVDQSTAATDRGGAVGTAVGRSASSSGASLPADPRALLDGADRDRIAGRTAEAAAKLRAIRTRFPRSAEAALAAYSLGSLSFGGDPGAAARWFETYLREAPRGPLAREALGRLMEARLRSGQTESARRAATDYLRRFPTGPHEDVANELLERKSPSETSAPRDGNAPRSRNAP